MKLYLVRHGDAVSPSLDPSQPLSTLGQIEVEIIAKILAKNGLSIDTILHSEKLRAKQTAEIIHTNLQKKPQLAPYSLLKPNDPIEPLLETLNSFENLMVVSHLPFLDELLSLLLTKGQCSSFIQLTTGCVAALSKEDSRWQLDWLLVPQFFKAETRI